MDERDLNLMGFAHAQTILRMERPTRTPRMPYETDERLKSFLDTNQMHREQMCLAIMAIDKRFADVRPRHPRGGPDGGRDIEAVFNNTQRAFGAVGFVNQANDSDEHKRKAMKKFKEDAGVAVAAEPRPEVFVFFTNVNLSIGEKDELIASAKALGLADAEVFDRERMRLALDNPDGLGIRFQYLKIPLSEAEQATFFARWGDEIQNVISQGFGRMERMLGRIQFLQEASAVMKYFTAAFELDREYDCREIGHFRAFAQLWLKEPQHGIVAVLFGSTDNSDRLDAATVESLTGANGICEGICGAQWERKFPEDENATELHLHRSGSLSGMGLERVKIIHIRYKQDDFIRMRPLIRLQDIDDCMLIFFVNASLARRLKNIHIYANEYKLAEMSKAEFRIDESTFDPELPLVFTGAELADSWVRVRPAVSSAFHLRFSEQTPKRVFSARETSDSSPQLS